MVFIDVTKLNEASRNAQKAVQDLRELAAREKVDLTEKVESLERQKGEVTIKSIRVFQDLNKKIAELEQQLKDRPIVTAYTTVYTPQRRAGDNIFDAFMGYSRPGEDLRKQLEKALSDIENLKNVNLKLHDFRESAESKNQTLQTKLSEVHKAHNLTKEELGRTRFELSKALEQLSIITSDNSQLQIERQNLRRTLGALRGWL